MKTAVDRFVSRQRMIRFWCILFLGATLGFSVVVWRLSAAINTKPLFVIVDGRGYLIVKADEFTEAKAFHIEQAELAVQSLFNRGPAGPDSPGRLKRLFERNALRKIEELHRGEAEEFAAKGLRQKIEIGEVKLLQLRDKSVQALVRGQLIRAGVFAEEPFVEVLDVEVRLLFVHNPDIVANGAFPTVVRDFEEDIRPMEVGR